MGLFSTKTRHRPMSGTEASEIAYGSDSVRGTVWNIWIPKFPLKGERDQCFVARLALVGGEAHLLLDDIDCGPVSPNATEAFDAIRDYGGESCPAILRITKPTAANFCISVRKVSQT